MSLPRNDNNELRRYNRQLTDRELLSATDDLKMITLRGTSGGPRHLAESLNTRKIGRKHCIQLKKSKYNGFGIKIAERDNQLGPNRPIYIIGITKTGAAYSDGRLREGDMLLEINGIDIRDKTQADVVDMLRDVKADATVEFVISRQELANEESSSNNDCDNERNLIDFEARLDILDGPGTYVYDIPINDTKSAGLGLYLKYPTMDGKDLGVYIKSVITGGAAWKDGRLQPNDQILAIDGINLMGLPNSVAADMLSAAVKGFGTETTSSTIRLNIHRRMRPQGMTTDDLESERPQSEESVDHRSGEERFQRDGFGRRSISEKKHAQLNAKATDTYKRNKKLREERERQRTENCCWFCGFAHPCNCVRNNNMGVQSNLYESHPNQESLVVRNAVRLARNASFRAAVDKSYG